ncbi:MAG: tRNA (adenosine(37)-N6)-threonylcarbamoyltransferase complex dimerization subunit type 1 TsaB [Chloroflexi bacterium]|nr:tRNA (adenosine(37)-N6)-threonylcarbamoyltransferase complex dimerization subunit type 1 TsaB [Chloroflexota bacterium]
MIILGIDTSTSFAGVGLSVNGVVTNETWQSRHNHGREVMPVVTRLLQAGAVEADEIDAVAVSLGPGGFSAVRVGIATANGLVAPRQTRLLGIPTHLIQAYPHRRLEGMRIVSLIPIGRNQISYGVFEAPFSALGDQFETGICGSDEVKERLEDSQTLICGEGAIPTTEASPKADTEVVRPPENLLSIALERIELGSASDGLVEPIYSRPPTITAPKRA